MRRIFTTLTAKVQPEKKANYQRTVINSAISNTNNSRNITRMMNWIISLMLAQMKILFTHKNTHNMPENTITRIIMLVTWMNLMMKSTSRIKIIMG